MSEWTSIIDGNEDPRWTALSLALQERGVVNHYSPSPVTVGLFSALSDEQFSALSAFQHIRLSSRISKQFMKFLKVQSSWTNVLGVCDGVIKDRHGWRPYCALFESFGQVLIELGGDLDMRGSVMIAGAGGAARVAIAAFFKAGFREFLVTNLGQDEAIGMIEEMRSRFFGLSIEWVPMDRIVLLPGNSSVLVNCTPSVEENILLTELSYLNFLKRPGILFDISRGLKPSILSQEAGDSGVSAVSGVDLAARTDVLWARWAFGAELDMKMYRERLQQVLTG